MRLYAARRYAFIVCLLQNWRAFYGFNIGVSYATVFKGDKTALSFGFSIAFYHRKGEKRLIVGAPDTVRKRGNEVIGQGAIYACHTDGSARCKRLIFDESGNDVRKTRNGTVVDREDKSHQWLGATLATGRDGVIVACAPRYVYMHGDSPDALRKLLIGQCYVSPDLQSTANASVISPCKKTVSQGPTDYEQQDKLGKCQAGFSAALSLVKVAVNPNSIFASCLGQLA